MPTHYNATDTEPERVYLEYRGRPSYQGIEPVSALRGVIPVGSVWHVSAYRANDGIGGYGCWEWNGRALIAAPDADPVSRTPARPSEVGRPWSALYPGRRPVTLRRVR